MNLQPLFSMQQALDDRILDEHGLRNTDLFPKKILALHVELCELANETRCFKYWSKKGPAPRETILEEYVDALHFVLSIGLDLGYADVDVHACALADATLTQNFLSLTSAVSTLSMTRGREEYRIVFSELLTLARLLGFEADEITRAYLAKNEVNHKRQSDGY